MQSMKKLFFCLSLLAIMVFIITPGFAQENDTIPEENDTIEAATETTDDFEDEEDVPDTAADTDDDDAFGHQMLKKYFVEGGGFMWPVLIVFILGLAVAIERIITLNLKTVNSDKLLNRLENSLANGNVEEAKDITRNTSGPVASIFYQALDRHEEGVEIVERSIVAYGSVQMGKLERGLVWLNLTIAIAPMLGFLGTVIGMILAFDAIEAQGDISPTTVAAGIKVALLTTVAGLIAAIILQVFYNYLVSKVDGMVNTMEDASISLVDVMLKHKILKERTTL